MKCDSSQKADPNFPHPSQSANVYWVSALFFSTLMAARGECGMCKMVCVLRNAYLICSRKWGLYRKKQWLTSDNPVMCVQMSRQGHEWFRSTEKGKCMLQSNTIREGTTGELGNWTQVVLKWSPPRLGSSCLCCVPQCLTWPLHFEDIYQVHDV